MSGTDTAPSAMNQVGQYLRHTKSGEAYFLAIVNIHVDKMYEFISPLKSSLS